MEFSILRQITILVITTLLLMKMCCGDIPRNDTGTKITLLDIEKKLWNTLFDRSGYNRNLLPVLNNTGYSLDIDISMSLISIVDVNEQEESFEVDGWLRIIWTDEQLKWKPSDYGNIKRLYVPVDQVWLPDLELFNGQQRLQLRAAGENAQIILYSTGNIWFIPPVRLATHCAMDLTYFPNDIQLCNITIGSWMRNNYQMSLKIYGDITELNMEQYQKHAEWNIIETKIWIKKMRYLCCPEQYETVEISIKMKRKDTLLQYMIETPKAVTTVTMPFIFLVPGKDSTVMGIGLIILESLMLLSAVEYLPFNIRYLPPFLSTYTILLRLTLAAIIINTLLRKIATTRNKALPAILTAFLLVVGRFLCVDGSLCCSSGGCCPSGGSDRAHLVVEDEGDYSVVERRENGGVNSSDKENDDTSSKKQKSREELLHKRYAEEWSNFGELLKRIFFLIYCIIAFILLCL